VLRTLTGSEDPGPIAVGQSVPLPGVIDDAHFADLEGSDAAVADVDFQAWAPSADDDVHIVDQPRVDPDRWALADEVQNESDAVSDIADADTHLACCSRELSDLTAPLLIMLSPSPAPRQRWENLDRLRFGRASGVVLRPVEDAAA
jgi:hypothetical protein